MGSSCLRDCWELQFPNGSLLILTSHPQVLQPYPQFLLQSLYISDIGQFFKSHEKNLEEARRRMGTVDNRF
jgi:hypothetical protein